MRTAVRFLSRSAILNHTIEKQSEFLLGKWIPSTLFSWNSSVKVKLHQIARGVDWGRHSSEQRLRTLVLGPPKPQVKVQKSRSILNCATPFWTQPRRINLLPYLGDYIYNHGMRKGSIQVALIIDTGLVFSFKMFESVQWIWDIKLFDWFQEPP